MHKKITLPLLLASSITGYGYNLDHQAGFYLDAKIGDAHFREIHTINIKKTNPAWQLNVGYEFIDFFALEAGYLRLPKITITAPTTAVTVQSGGPTLAAKWMLPMNNLRFYAKYIASSLKDTPKIENHYRETVTVTKGGTKYVGFYGFGLDYRLTDYFYLNGEVSYSRPNHLPDITLGLIGLTYKFS